MKYRVASDWWEKHKDTVEPLFSSAQPFSPSHIKNKMVPIITVNYPCWWPSKHLWSRKHYHEIVIPAVFNMSHSSG